MLYRFCYSDVYNIDSPHQSERSPLRRTQCSADALSCQPETYVFCCLDTATSQRDFLTHSIKATRDVVKVPTVDMFSINYIKRLDKKKKKKE